MSDILHRLDHLRRPRLLIRAARIGAEDYRRDIHLPRLLGHGTLPRHALALARLMEIETVMNDNRRAQEADYSTIRHVEVMIAVISEARILRASQMPRDVPVCAAVLPSVGTAVLLPLPAQAAASFDRV